MIMSTFNDVMYPMLHRHCFIRYCGQGHNVALPSCQFVACHCALTLVILPSVRHSSTCLSTSPCVDRLTVAVIMTASDCLHLQTVSVPFVSLWRLRHISSDYHLAFSLPFSHSTSKRLCLSCSRACSFVYSDASQFFSARVARQRYGSLRS